MIKLRIHYKKLNEKVVILLKDHGELQEIIKKIKPSDMAIKDYSVNLSHENLLFFQKTYTPKFFTPNHITDEIDLHSISNGTHRVLKYKKTPDNNATLKKVIERISETLKENLGAIDFSFDVIQEEFKPTRYHFINIKLEDLRNNQQHLMGKCIIKFDKQKWAYEFIELNTTRLKEVFAVIKEAFDKKTIPTKVYRGKKYENRIE